MESKKKTFQNVKKTWIIMKIVDNLKKDWKMQQCLDNLKTTVKIKKKIEKIVQEAWRIEKNRKKEEACNI